MRVKSECKNKDKKKSTQSARSARSAQSARSAVCSLQSAWSAFWRDRFQSVSFGFHLLVVKKVKVETACIQLQR